METGKINANQAAAAAALAAFKKPDKQPNSKPILNHHPRGEAHQSTSQIHPNAASNTSLSSSHTSSTLAAKARAKYPVPMAQQQVKNIYHSLLSTPKSSATDLTHKRTPSKMAASAGIAAKSRSDLRAAINTLESTHLTTSISASPSVLSAAAISAARSLQIRQQTSSSESATEHTSDRGPSLSSTSVSPRVVTKQSIIIPTKRPSNPSKSQPHNTSAGAQSSEAIQTSSTSQSPIPSSSDVSSVSLSNPSLAVVGKLNLVKSQAKAKENIQKLKSSIESRITTRDHGQSRILEGYAPLEMLKNVRDAISSHMVTKPTPLLQSEEGNAMIQSFRDSVNQRRLIHMSQSDSHLPYGLHERISPMYSPGSPNLTEGNDYFSLLKTTSNLEPILSNLHESNDQVSAEGLTKETPVFDITLHFTPNKESYGDDYFAANRSLSESGSGSGGLYSPTSASVNHYESDLDYDRAHEELISVSASNLSPSDSEQESKSFGRNIIFPHGNGSRLVSSDLLQSPYLSKHMRTPSIASTLSLSSSFKNLDFQDSGTLIGASFKSPLSTLVNQNINGESKPKPKRKAPPHMLQTELVSPITPKVSNLSNTSLPAAGEDQAAFPRYPEIFKRGKQDPQSLLFGKKKALKQQKGVDYDVNLLDDHEGDTMELPTTPTARGPHHAVRLKTTMRDQKKGRKDKHKFNEDKPWKHHSDLNFLSDSERKRYEGIWMSNKGLYISAVATKLVGVNYEGTEGSKKTTTTAQTTSAGDQSLLAARLSAHHKTADLKASDAQFHNLESVEPNQLIHGIVIKRIWKRSRLPDATLETIWNLVDYRKDGTLNKPEFLVGMWLIDQCLYGRKLPKKVDDKVWESLGSIGVTLRKRKR